MKTLTLIILLIIILIIGIFFTLFLFEKQRSQQQQSTSFYISSLLNMKIESEAFSNNQFIPKKYTCDGEDINPPLKISEVPQGTKSLVLIVDDPDAPMGTWVHWTVWNIPPDISDIPENTVPQGAIEGMTDFGRPGYGGPCPPSGVHRYFFKLYALDTTLELDSSATKRDLEKAMEGHILEKAELIGLYQRQ